MSDSARRVIAAAAYIRALRSGEGSAAMRAEPFLADDVVLTVGQSETKGKAAVVAHITGAWPNTPVYLMGGWSEPSEVGDAVIVEAEFPPLGAGAERGTVTFGFDQDDRISSVTEVYQNSARPEATKEIPLVAKGLINSALANGTPMVVAYVDEDGTPQLSLRGSTQVFSPTQLCIWLRSPEGGLTKALASNPTISLLYRDSRSRTTLVIKGRGRIATDENTRDRVFELVPEVEQMHDPKRTGAALIIDVTEMRGGTPKGAVLVQP